MESVDWRNDGEKMHDELVWDDLVLVKKEVEKCD